MEEAHACMHFRDNRRQRCIVCRRLVNFMNGSSAIYERP